MLVEAWQCWWRHGGVGGGMTVLVEAWRCWWRHAGGVSASNC